MFPLSPMNCRHKRSLSASSVPNRPSGPPTLLTQVLGMEEGHPSGGLGWTYWPEGCLPTFCPGLHKLPVSHWFVFCNFSTLKNFSLAIMVWFTVKQLNALPTFNYLVLQYNIPAQTNLKTSGSTFNHTHNDIFVKYLFYT